MHVHSSHILGFTVLNVLHEQLPMRVFFILIVMYLGFYLGIFFFSSLYIMHVILNVLLPRSRQKSLHKFKLKGTLEGIVPLKSVHLCLQEGPLSFKDYTSKKDTMYINICNWQVLIDYSIMCRCSYNLKRFASAQSVPKKRKKPTKNFCGN